MWRPYNKTMTGLQGYGMWLLCIEYKPGSTQKTYVQMHIYLKCLFHHACNGAIYFDSLYQGHS